MKKALTLSLVVGLALSSRSTASAQETLKSAQDEVTLLKDFGRQALADQGYTIEISILNDTWGNATGGRYRRASAVGNLNTILEIDTSKAGWWENGRFLFWGIYVYGGQPSRAVGDYQYSSNIDSFETYEPFEGYYEHSFADNQIELRAGIKDFTLEFATLDYGFDMINSSFFTPSTITQVPYSFYPATGLGMELSAKLPCDTYAIAGVFDGKPSDRRQFRSRDLSLSASDGAYYIAEVGYLSLDEGEPHTKVALGAWYDTSDFIDVNDQARDANYGSYLLAERLIWQEADGSQQGLGVFGQVGQAASDRNFNSWYYGGGISYRGLFPDRDDDTFGLGIANARISSQYRELNPGTELAETAYEINYRAVLLPWFALTPDVQYIRNPGADPELSDAVIIYLRSEINL